MKGQGNILRVLVILFAICLSTFTVWGQQIQVSLPNDVIENETFLVQYEMVSDYPVQEMPQLLEAKDVELVAKPKVSQSYPSLFWGITDYTLTLVYSFKAKKTGKINIPRLEVSVNGKKIRSEKQTLEIREIANKDDVEGFVKVTSTKQSINPGDTLTVTYKLYTTKEISNVASFDLSRNRELYYQDLSPRRLIATTEKVGGVEYKVYTIRQYKVQGTSLGVKEIPSGSIKVEYSYPTGRTQTDVWGRRYEEVLREYKSYPIESVSIRVHNMMAI